MRIDEQNNAAPELRRRSLETRRPSFDTLIAPEMNYLREMNRGSAHSELYLYYKK